MKRARLYETLTRYDADSPPCHLGGHASLEQRKENASHDELCAVGGDSAVSTETWLGR